MAANEAAAPQRFAEFREKWPLLDMSNDLELLFGGIGDSHRPEVALRLGSALVAYLDAYRGPARS